MNEVPFTGLRDVARALTPMIHLPPLLQRTFPADSFNSRLKPLTRRAYVIAFMLPNKRTSRFIAPFSSPKYLRKVRTAGPEPGHLEKYLQKNTSNRAKTGPNTSNRAKIGPEKYLQSGQIRATDKYLQPGQFRARKIPPTGPNSGHRKIPPDRIPPTGPNSGQKNTSNRAKFGPPKNTSRLNTSNRATFGPQQYLQIEYLQNRGYGGLRK